MTNHPNRSRQSTKSDPPDHPIIALIDEARQLAREWRELPEPATDDPRENEALRQLLCKISESQHQIEVATPVILIGAIELLEYLAHDCRVGDVDECDTASAYLNELLVHMRQSDDETD
jgi:hypothetical protein